RDLRASVGRPLEVRPYARPQRLGLADVEHTAVVVAEEVDARLRREALELFLDPLRHVLRSGYRGGVRGLLAAAAAAAALTMLVPNVLPPSAHAGGPSLQIGAAEDDVKAPSLLETKAKLDLLRLAGLNAVRVTSTWDPLNPDPSPSEITVL